MNNTKGVRPFYIKYESWMTDEQVAEVLDKAVAAGATLREGVRRIHAPDNEGFTPARWVYFGIDFEGYTIFMDDLDSDIPLITLDQVDEHLGIKEETTMELRNVKIDLRKEDGSVDEELSRAFRDAVIESGGTYLHLYDNDKYTPFLFVTEQGKLLWEQWDYEDSFKEDTEYREITFEYERKLTWSAKPKEKVKETVEICGVKYYKEDVDSLLATLKPVV